MYCFNTPSSTEYKGYGHYKFFNLKDDISESRNLAEGVDLSKKNPAAAIIEEKDRTIFLSLAKELNQWLINTEAELPYLKGTKDPAPLPEI
jgi:hypothetical protein